MDMLFEMDKVVGSLVSMIDDRGLAEDTIIIFTSDNGGLKTSVSSEHGHNSQVPFVVQRVMSTRVVLEYQ